MNMNQNRLLSISTDRLLFQEGSAVRSRLVAHARAWGEVHVIVATDAAFTETSIAPNIWIYPTRSKFKALYPLDALKLGRFIVKGRQITNITCQDPFLTAYAGVALKKESGLPLEIQVHTDISSPNFGYTIGNKIRKALALSYLPKADTIRTVSEKTKEYLVSTLGISAEKITVRPIPVDTTAIKAAPVTVDLHRKYRQFSKIALMASRFEREKNIELAIHAWKSVVKKEPRAGLVIVGKGTREARLRNLADRLGLSDNVVFEPWGASGELYSFYKTADLFLTTSLFEGYGMTLVEAQAAGCPIVSTDVGIAREVGAHIVAWNEQDVTRGITQTLGV